MWGYEEGRGEKRRGGDECRVNHGVWQQSRWAQGELGRTGKEEQGRVWSDYTFSEEWTVGGRKGAGSSWVHWLCTQLTGWRTKWLQGVSG
jgi:hypothetical protein